MVGTLGPGIGVGRAARFRYVATAGQTTFSGADASAQALTLNYTPGFLEVAVDGVWLTPDEYTATNGSSIVFATGLAVGRVVYAYSLSAMSVANTYDKTQNGADITVPATFRSYLPNPGAIWGLTMSTAGASATMSIAAGAAADSTNTRLMTLASAIAKTTSAWAAGTAVGGLDTGVIANSTWYHFFEIMNVAIGAVDIVFSATATPASGPTTLPTGFTLFRRIGSGKTNGSAQWTLFQQIGDEFIWDVPAQDVNANALGASALFTLTMPSGFSLRAKLNVTYISSTVGADLLVQSPVVTTQTVNTPIGNVTLSALVASVAAFAYVEILTNTSAQIRATASGSAPQFYVVTIGWIDTRGRN